MSWTSSNKINKEGCPVSHREAEQPLANKTADSFRESSYGTQELQSPGAAILSTVIFASSRQRRPRPCKRVKQWDRPDKQECSVRPVQRALRMDVETGQDGMINTKNWKRCLTAMRLSCQEKQRGNGLPALLWGVVILARFLQVECEVRGVFIRTNGC
jgi:hypothetical protein